ncbi:hypothetical protein N7454_003573 [Penicillium verhagenii]|nr:hypothetical protein N7454_003573 [Penicillium verhagenii]
MTDFYISQPDLFLLEHWQKDSPLSIDAQREQIFAKWVALGTREREPYYHQQIGLGDLPTHSQELLNRIRLPTERLPVTDFKPYWLRTCYKPESEEAWTKIQSELEFNFGDLPPIYNDPALYNFGNNWEKIFLRTPQLLRNTCLAEEYEDDVAEALQEGIEAEKFDEEEDSDSEDAMPWMTFYSEYLWRLSAGRIYIVDATTLASNSKDRNAGKVLVVWYDECGRGIRYYRQELDKAVDETGLFDYILRDRACWENAEICESYEEGAPLGPPYGEENSKDETSE